MEYIKQQLKRDLRRELIDNYRVELDSQRWNHIIETEVTEFLKSHTFKMDQIVKHRNYIDRRLFTIDETTCQARIWNEGHGGQCCRRGIFQGFCGKHKTEEQRWCGIITEERPQHPVNTRGKTHTWKS